MKDIYKCKKMCMEFGKCCHNTKNRVIEKMCHYEKDHCKVLAEYLQTLMVTECLCCYIETCCCEHETLTPHIVSELSHKCHHLMNLCGLLHKFLEENDKTYLRCSEISKYCGSCKTVKNSKKKHRGRRSNSKVKKRTRR